MATRKFSAITQSSSNLTALDFLMGVTAGNVDLLFSPAQLTALIFASPTITGHATIEGVTATGATGTGKFVFDTSPTLVTPALGTPSAGVLTNCTGTASGLTAGNVTTNANLTGVITSSGNTTSIASQTGTGSKFVVDTSPTLVTPVLGVAAGTSLALGGATIGSNALAVKGTAAIAGSSSGVITLQAQAAAGTYNWNYPTTAGNSGDVLTSGGGGSTAMSWVTPIAINNLTDTWNNVATTFTAIKMNVTDTNSASASLLLDLQVGSATKFNVRKDGTATAIVAVLTPSLTLGTASSATGTLKLANASSANLTTIQAGNAANARTYTWPTDFGAAGTVLTDAAGNGTLSWAAGGGGGLTIGTTTITSGTTTRLLYDLGGVVQEASGVTVNATSNGLTLTAAATGAASLLTLTGQTGVLAASQPIINATQTWNAAGVTFQGVLINITNTASASGSKILDLQVGGSSVVNVDWAGRLQTAILRGTANPMYVRSVDDSVSIQFNNADTTINKNIAVASGIIFGWGNVAFSGCDAFLGRSAAATFQYGAANAASPVNQTIQAQGSRSGTDSNVGGANLTMQSGAGTGTGTASSLIFNTPVLAASGSGAQTQTMTMTLTGGFIQIGANGLTANSTTATVLGSVGPSGANTTVQEWLTVKGTSGATRYIPCF